MKSEAEVQAMIRLEAGSLWRNNVGAFEDKSGRWVRFGLGNDSASLNAKFKSSDLVGVTPHVVTLSDLGRTIGVFTAIECKAPGERLTGKRAAAQLRFLEHIRSLGGFAGFARSVDEYREALKWRQ